MRSLCCNAGAGKVGDIAYGKDVGITRPKQRVDQDPVAYIKARSFRKRDVGINPDTGNDGIHRKAATVDPRTNNEVVALSFPSARPPFTSTEHCARCVRTSSLQWMAVR
jgi:hypothetical protein